MRWRPVLLEEGACTSSAPGFLHNGNYVTMTLASSGFWAFPLLPGKHADKLCYPTRSSKPPCTEYIRIQAAKKGYRNNMKQLGLERRVWGLASGLTCTSFHWFSMLSLWLVGQTCWWLEWEHKNCWQRTLFSSSGCAVESWSCKENSQDIESSRQPKEFHWCPRLAPQLVLETVSSSWPRCPACQRPSPIQYPQYRQPLIVCLWRTMHQSFQHRSMTFHDYLGSASSSPFASWVSGSSCVDWVSNMVSFKVSSNRFMWKDRGQVINFYKPRLATLIENFLNFFLSFRQL